MQARGKIAAAKVLAPSTVLEVLDTAIQAHGGWPGCGRAPARCASPTARTTCTSSPSPGWSSGSACRSCEAAAWQAVESLLEGDKEGSGCAADS